MRKILLIFTSVLIVLVYACDDQSVNELRMGEEYIKDESGIVLIDTFSLELSTVIIDSIQTSAISSVMTGKYYNEIFGEVSAEPVFRLEVPSVSKFDEDDVFDSITICLDYNEYYMDDTSSVQTINVMELDTDLEELDRTTFYAHNRVDVKDEALGQVIYSPRPTKKELLEARLDDAFGQRLFDLFINDADEVQSTSEFQDYFRGMVLKPGENDESIIGFSVNDTSLCLKMYYHRIEKEKEELEATFSMGSSTYMFNQIKCDRSNTKYAPLVDPEEGIRATQTDNVTMVQGSSGLMTKIKFPGLANVFQLVELDQIIKVELVLTPIDETEDVNDLPSSLIVYESNKVNKLNSIYSDSSGNAYYLTLNESDDNFESYPYYTLDLTEYVVENLISGYFDPNNAIIISLDSDSMQDSFTSLMFAGESHPMSEYKPKLNIYTYYY